MKHSLLLLSLILLLASCSSPDMHSITGVFDGNDKPLSAYELAEEKLFCADVKVHYANILQGIPLPLTTDEKNQLIAQIHSSRYQETTIYGLALMVYLKRWDDIKGITHLSPGVYKEFKQALTKTIPTLTKNDFKDALQLSAFLYKTTPFDIDLVEALSSIIVHSNLNYRAKEKLLKSYTQTWDSKKLPGPQGKTYSAYIPWDLTELLREEEKLYRTRRKYRYLQSEIQAYRNEDESNPYIPILTKKLNALQKEYRSLYRFNLHIIAPNDANFTLRHTKSATTYNSAGFYNAPIGSYINYQWKDSNNTENNTILQKNKNYRYLISSPQTNKKGLISYTPTYRKWYQANL